MKKNKQKQLLQSDIDDKLKTDLIGKKNTDEQQKTQKNHNDSIPSLDEKTLTGHYLTRVKKIEEIIEQMENEIGVPPL